VSVQHSLMHATKDKINEHKLIKADELENRINSPAARLSLSFM